MKIVIQGKCLYCGLCAQFFMCVMLYSQSFAEVCITSESVFNRTTGQFETTLRCSIQVWGEGEKVKFSKIS